MIPDSVDELIEALKSLHDDCVEYARINNLHNEDGSPATNHSILRASALLEKLGVEHSDGGMRTAPISISEMVEEISKTHRENEELIEALKQYVVADTTGDMAEVDIAEENARAVLEKLGVKL